MFIIHGLGVKSPWHLAEGVIFMLDGVIFMVEGVIFMVESVKFEEGYAS